MRVRVRVVARVDAPELGLVGLRLRSQHLHACAAVRCMHDCRLFISAMGRRAGADGKARVESWPSSRAEEAWPRNLRTLEAPPLRAHACGVCGDAHLMRGQHAHVQRGTDHAEMASPQRADRVMARMHVGDRGSRVRLKPTAGRSLRALQGVSDGRERGPLRGLPGR